MIPRLGTGELVVILVIVVLIFGVNKIPQLGKGLGEGIRNFKSSLKAAKEEDPGIVWLDVIVLVIMGCVIFVLIKLDKRSL